MTLDIAQRLDASNAAPLAGARLHRRADAMPVMATPLAVAAGVTAVAAAFTAGISVGIAAG